MLGCSVPPFELPDKTFTALKEHLADPARYFLGEHYGAVVLPSSDRSSEITAFLLLRVMSSGRRRISATRAAAVHRSCLLPLAA